MAGDKYWDAYFPKTRDQLIAMQQPDGSWNGDGIGQVYGTAIAAIILQLPFKYLPVFQRSRKETRHLSTSRPRPKSSTSPRLEELRSAHNQIREQIARQIVGQDEVVEQLLMAVFARGHCILEGVPGPGQDADGPLAGAVAVAGVQPDPVHARPDAQRHHRHRGALRGPQHRRAGAAVRPGADLRQPDPGRRDQPHAAQDAGRAARGDAGTAGDRRRAPAPACPTRSSCWPRRTRSSRRAPIRCPRRSSTASCSRSSSPIRRRTRSGGSTG